MNQPLDALDYALLVALSCGQIGLLITSLVKQAAQGQAIKDIDRRITSLENPKP